MFDHIVGRVISSSSWPDSTSAFQLWWRLIIKRYMWKTIWKRWSVVRARKWWRKYNTSPHRWQEFLFNSYLPFLPGFRSPLSSFQYSRMSTYFFPLNERILTKRLGAMFHVGSPLTTSQEDLPPLLSPAEGLDFFTGRTCNQHQIYGQSVLRKKSGILVAMFTHTGHWERNSVRIHI